MSPIAQLWKHYYRSSKHDSRSKHVRRDERFLLLARIDKLYHELKWNMLMKGAHWAFYWPKYACINLADIWTVNLQVHGTCLD